MFNKILVTTDGSELALKGVRGAAQLAGQLKAELIVVTVEEPYSYSNVTAYRPESFEQYKDRVKAETEERLESARKAVDAEGIKAETVALSMARIPLTALCSSAMNGSAISCDREPRQKRSFGSAPRQCGPEGSHGSLCSCSRLSVRQQKGAESAPVCGIIKPAAAPVSRGVCFYAIYSNSIRKQRWQI